jgi:hypothetical protein
MTDECEVHAEVQGDDECIGVFDGVAAREDGLALFRDGTTVGFIHYNRSPVAVPVTDTDAAEELTAGTDSEGAAG